MMSYDIHAVPNFTRCRSAAHLVKRLVHMWMFDETVVNVRCPTLAHAENVVEWDALEFLVLEPARVPAAEGGGGKYRIQM